MPTVSQYATCRARRFLLGGEPEAEQGNTGSLTDIGSLAKQARTEVRSGPAYREKGGDLDGR